MKASCNNCVHKRYCTGVQKIGTKNGQNCGDYVSNCSPAVRIMSGIMVWTIIITIWLATLNQIL